MSHSTAHDHRSSWAYIDDVLESVEKFTRNFNQMDRDHILFDALSSQLSLSVCIEQFLLHMTFPLLLPVFVYRYGWTMLYSQYFNKWSTWLFSILFTLMIISIPLSEEFIGIQCTFPCMLYLIHRVMVSLKYGTLSPSEYNNMMYGNSEGRRESGFPSDQKITIVAEYQQQSMILTGWLVLSWHMINYEMLTAAGRLGIDAQDYTFFVPNPENGKSEQNQLLRWQRFLASPHDGHVKGMVINSDGSYSVSVQQTCLVLMQRSEPHVLRRLLTVLSGAVVLLSASIPLFCEHKSLGSLSGWGIVYYATSFLVNIMYSYAALSFILTAFVDTLRRFNCAQMLESMVRMADVDHNIKVRIGTALSHPHKTEVYAVNKILERSGNFLLDQKLSDGQGSVELQRGNSGNHRDTDTNFKHSDVYFPTKCEGEESTCFDMVPKLDLRYGPNYIAWAICRVQLQNFGTRMRFRLDVINGKRNIIF